MIDLFVNAALSTDEVLHFPKGVRKIFSPFLSKYEDKIFFSTDQIVRGKNPPVFLMYNY